MIASRNVQRPMVDMISTGRGYSRSILQYHENYFLCVRGGKRRNGARCGQRQGPPCLYRSKGFLSTIVCSRPGPTETRIISVPITPRCAGHSSARWPADRKIFLHRRGARSSRPFLHRSVAAPCMTFELAGNSLDSFSRYSVRRADRDFFKTGQHVELGERDAGHAIHAHGVAHADGVEPAAAARPAGGGAELRAFSSQSLPSGPSSSVGNGPLPTRVV